MWYCIYNFKIEATSRRKDNISMIFFSLILLLNIFYEYLHLLLYFISYTVRFWIYLSFLSFFLGKTFLILKYSRILEINVDRTLNLNPEIKKCFCKTATVPPSQFQCFRKYQSCFVNEKVNKLPNKFL